MSDGNDRPAPSDDHGADAPVEHDSAVAVVDAPRRPAEPDVAPGRESSGGEPGVDATPPGGTPSAPPWPLRAARRAVRRPVAWADRPWTTARVVRTVVTGATLLVTTLVMMSAVHLLVGDDLVFERNTPTGGDMGAHVWGPAFLRDHLLPNFQLTGWSMDWYAGMPAYRFYMVVPALAIVAFDVVLPYGVAFKLVAVSGLVTLPFCCWAFGRLARFRYPLPELFAVGGMLFALDESFSIYGGNLKSTMAGEFSFSIALSLMMLGLGLLARGMRTGQYRSWSAIVLALAIVCHGIVAIYAAFGALVIVLVNTDGWRRLWFGATTGIAVVLLSAWWIGPFLGNHQYMTDMKYGARPEGAGDSFYDMFFPLTAPLDVLVTALAVVGFLACVARRHANGTALGVIGLLTVAGVYATRDSLPVIGLLWNPRLLPLLYLVRYLLMMVGIVEIVGVIVAAWRDRSVREPTGWVAGSVTAGVVGLSSLLVLGFMFEVLPGDGRRVFHDANAPVYAWGPLRKTPTGGDAQGDGWSRYNFGGYEGRPSYPEYHDVVQTMARIGQTNGCGRVTWENNEDNGQYGTTMALMLLPHWTDGCIASMEGLFFEASGTTPYHFLTTAAMSKQSSNPVRELRYVDNDATVGVPHLQDLGVRYVMVRTPEAQTEAATADDLMLLAESGPWQIYEVADSDVVAPLEVQPVVVASRPGDQRERNLELGTSWFQHRDEWPAMPADDGPESWQRIEVEVDEARREDRRVDIVVPTEPVEPVTLPAVEVSDVEMGQQDVSFRVDQVGVPVLVRVSYFPNWQADGADGPYRIAPNMMVVVPTDTEVSLRFERSASDVWWNLLTLAGIALLVLFRIRGDVVLDPPARVAAGAPPVGDDVGTPGAVDDPAAWMPPDDTSTWPADGGSFEPPAPPARAGSGSPGSPDGGPAGPQGHPLA